MAATTSPIKTPEKTQVSFSRQQPVWHVLVLMIATGKLYFLVWCFRCWKLLADDIDCSKEPDTEPFLSRISPETLASFQKVSPLLRTVGLAIPYWNNYLFLTLSLGVARLIPTKTSFAGKHPFLSAVLVVLSWITLSMLSVLPGAWYLFFLTCAIPVAVVQHWLNAYWRSKEPKGMLVRHGFSGFELIAIVVGCLYLGYIVSSFMLGANN